MRHARNNKNHQAWLGLGGNIGDVRSHFRYALNTISARADCDIVAVSSLYQTAPWGQENQADFLNACLSLRTSLTPHNLLKLCLQIENECGRQRQEKWGARSLDIDILFYEGCDTLENNHLTKDSELILPHPHIAKRAFVIIPLAEISPDMTFEGMSLKQRAAIMQKNGQAEGIKKLSKSIIG